MPNSGEKYAIAGGRARRPAGDWYHRGPVEVALEVVVRLAAAARRIRSAASSRSRSAPTAPSSRVGSCRPAPRAPGRSPRSRSRVGGCHDQRRLATSSSEPGERLGQDGADGEPADRAHGGDPSDRRRRFAGSGCSLLANTAISCEAVPAVPRLGTVATMSTVQRDLRPHPDPRRRPAGGRRSLAGQGRGRASRSRSPRRSSARATTRWRQRRPPRPQGGCEGALDARCTASGSGTDRWTAPRSRRPARATGPSRSRPGAIRSPPGSTRGDQDPGRPRRRAGERGGRPAVRAGRRRRSRSRWPGRRTASCCASPRRCATRAVPRRPGWRPPPPPRCTTCSTGTPCASWSPRPRATRCGWTGERALYGSWYEFFPRSEGAVIDPTGKPAAGPAPSHGRGAHPGRRRDGLRRRLPAARSTRSARSTARAPTTP